MRSSNIVVNAAQNKVVVAKTVSEKIREFIASNFGFGCDWIDQGDSFVLFGLRSAAGLNICLNSGLLGTL